MASPDFDQSRRTTDRPIFGRAADIDRLMGRARCKGLTAVMGRPQQGKTRLVREVRDRLRADPHRFLVGYAESSGQTSDLILRAVMDLYASWLGDATFAQQARALYEQHKDSLLPSLGRWVGGVLGHLFAATAGCAPGSAGPGAGEAVERAFDGLLRANESLRTGGLALPTLDYDRALEVVTNLATVAKRPIVLILDAWEQGADPRVEAGTLRKYLANIDEWPAGFHVLLCLRDHEPQHETFALANELCDQSALADRYRLGPMALDDPAEQRRLLAYLVQEVPATAAEPPTTLLELLNGYPGTFRRWIDGRPGDAASLARLANEAQRLRYSELGPRLNELLGRDATLFGLAARLALLPEMPTASYWAAFRDAVMDGSPPTALDDLQTRGILDPHETSERGAPRFGHTTRYEAARAWLLTQAAARARLRTAAESLVLGLAAAVRTGTEADALRARGLRAVAGAAAGLRCSNDILAVCAVACQLFRDTTAPVQAASLIGGWTLALAARVPHASAFLASALFTTLNHAKEENDLPRRDALLEELRALANAHPREPAVREMLSKGLFNALNHAKEENDLPRRDALLEGLRALANAHPQEPAVREKLAMGLFNTLNHAKEENDLPRRDALLEELRALANAHPREPAVREMLATGLSNTLVCAKEENDLPRRDALLEELRALANAHPREPAVRERLSKGLFNTLVCAKEENDLPRRDALLEELRALANAHPREPAVRERLAMALSNTLIHAKEENDLPRRDALLEELRALANAHPREPAVREWLATGLFNTLVCAKKENDLPRRDALLEELRALANAHPREPAVRERLAMGLSNTLVYAKEENDLPRRDALLEELRALANANPEVATALDILRLWLAEHEL
jgi:hypothetical protein